MKSQKTKQQMEQVKDGVLAQKITPNFAQIRENNLDTLAVIATDKYQNREISIKGKGSEITDPETIRNRSKRKLITSVLMLKLIKLAEKKGEHELAQSFRNTYYCLSKLIVADGVMFGLYCRNRFCTLCSGYRKSDLINKYLPVVKTWDQPYFVTLTVRSVPAKKLKLMISKVNEGFRKINLKYNKRYERNKGTKLVGIRTLECNFNHIRRTYNPHLHVLVATREMAHILVAEWLALWGKPFTSRKGQFIRKVESANKDLVEIIKYNTKIFTTNTDSSKKAAPPSIYIKAMYNIIVSMKGLHIIDRFGFNLPKTTDKLENTVTQLSHYDEVSYSLRDTDWIDEVSGEKLSDFILDSELRDLLKNQTDTVTE